MDIEHLGNHCVQVRLMFFFRLALQVTTFVNVIYLFLKLDTAFVCVNALLLCNRPLYINEYPFAVKGKLS
jgi:hypothetical protein